MATILRGHARLDHGHVCSKSGHLFTLATRLSCCSKWQIQNEDRSAAVRRFEPEVAAHLFGESPAQRQSQALSGSRVGCFGGRFMEG